MNRDRRKEAGKVFLDLSKYLATTVAISGLFTKEAVNWLAVVLGMLLALVGFSCIYCWSKNYTVG